MLLKVIVLKSTTLNIDHRIIFARAQLIVTSAAVSVGPFRLAVVVGDWVEYIILKAVNASTFCYTLAPEGSNSTLIIFKPLNEGDRIKIIIKRMGTGQWTHYINSATSLLTEGFASCDLYLNGIMLWSADSMMNDYRPMGLDFYYVVGDGYWDTIRGLAGHLAFSVAVGNPNVTLSYSYLLESGGGRVDSRIVVNKYKGIVLESIRTSYDQNMGIIQG